MNWMDLLLSVPLLGLLAGPAPAPPGLSPPITYTGMCDASAAVAIGADLFVVANDEDNILRVYRRDEAGAPVASFPLDAFLDLDPKHPKRSEADIEGAARVGDRIYWITSHGLNKDGEERPNRRRFFATEVREVGGKIRLTVVGTPYKDLLKDLEQESDLGTFHLDKAAGRKPESKDGLNIEGLAATPQGHLLIGFRNPLPKGRALLVPLKNPDEIIRGEKAKFGKPITLDLGKRGVRSIERGPEEDQYLIVAGAPDDQKDFRLYRWTGDGDDAPERIPGIEFGGLNPEALFFTSEGGRGRVHVLSDDGGQIVDGQECKDLDESQRRFRGARVTP
jgi:hypothetical protein